MHEKGRRMKPINIRRLKVGDRVQHTVYGTVVGEVVDVGVGEGWINVQKELTVDVSTRDGEYVHRNYPERFWRKINADTGRVHDAGTGEVSEGGSENRTVE
jgi:hypothetical protein